MMKRIFVGLGKKEQNTEEQKCVNTYFLMGSSINGKKGGVKDFVTAVQIKSVTMGGGGSVYSVNTCL